MGRTEPSAAHREAASGFRQMFVALRAEGFDETQTMAIVTSLIIARQNEP